MQTVTLMFLAFAVGCCVISGVPVKRNAPPPSNSRQCKDIYHGQCIDTYKYKCNGMLIPGVCNNITHFNSIDFGSLTQIQCCNGWLINQVAQGGK